VVVVRGEVHASNNLPLGKEPTLPVTYECRWIPDSLWFCTEFYSNVQLIRRLHIDKYLILMLFNRTVDLTAKLVPTFVDKGVSHSQCGGSQSPYSRFSKPKPIRFLSSSSLIVLTTLSGPRSKLTKIKTKLHGLSPRANYTDRATAACWQSDCQLLRTDGATWSAWRISTAVFSIF
jgi:hypothetical protein